MFNTALNRIWLALLLATGVTYWLGESGLSGSVGMVPVLLMFAMAAAKGLWVIYDFMELRHAPRMWRVLLVGWLAFVTSMIVLAYWIGLR
jgi:cytochrome c oxidase subunit 4